MKVFFFSGLRGRAGECCPAGFQSRSGSVFPDVRGFTPRRDLGAARRAEEGRPGPRTRFARTAATPA